MMLELGFLLLPPNNNQNQINSFPEWTTQIEFIFVQISQFSENQGQGEFWMNEGLCMI